MANQYHFETAKSQHGERSGREYTRLDRFRARDALRKERQIEINRVTAARIQHTIAELERKVVSLEDSVEAELERAESRDPSNFAYPMAARALRSRRDNLQSTIGILRKRLTAGNVAER